MELNVRMKKDQVRLLGGAFAAALVALSGCYSYKEPAVATLSESYTQRQKDSSDDMFKDISVLTLREAQRIAIKNNPTYISAYHSMQAARLKYLQAWGAYSPTITASFDMDYSARAVTVKDGDEMMLGDHKFKFVFAPMVHWPEVMFSFDETEGTLFSADAFGSYGAVNGSVFAENRNLIICNYHFAAVSTRKQYPQFGDFQQIFYFGRKFAENIFELSGKFF